MTTIRIPIVPNAITTFTDETEEHCIRYKTTIQIDKAPLKISPELLARLIKAASELDLTPKRRLVKRYKYNQFQARIDLLIWVIAYIYHYLYLVIIAWLLSLLYQKKVECQFVQLQLKVKMPELILILFS